MSAPDNNSSRPLSVLGISETEERIYRWLLAHPHASASQVARALALSPKNTQRLLDSIESKGLSTHTPERPRRYIPASPDIAIEALSQQKSQAVQRAQAMIPDLREQVSTHYNEQEQMVELVSSPEVLAQYFAQIQNSAKDEVINLVRLPVLLSRLGELNAGQNIQKKAVDRGVHFRSIVDAEYLESAGAMGRTREDMKAGEEVRVVPHLPLKIVLVDRRIALIPLSLGQPDSPSLIVRSSTLLDSLYALFETLWKRAVPISFTDVGGVEYGPGDSEYSDISRHLITLLASGLNDKTIAGELDMSSATLNRRIVAMMKALGVRTRFQAGWQARGLCLAEKPKKGNKRRR